MDATRILQAHSAELDEYLRGALPRSPQVPPRLLEAIEYSLFAGGKRLRPALVIECYRACGGGESSNTVLAAAAAVELIHTFSLVHDDLPAMDDDDLRRGKPTSHKVFGEAMAILAGDAMVALAFELLSRDASADLAAKLVHELSAATGPAGMIGGQVRDIQAENQSLVLQQLMSLHRMKTGALITASCRMGAICAGGGDEMLSAASALGEHLGLAFQIVDDLLDVTSTDEQLGKRTRKDQPRGKNTYPTLLGIDGSRKVANDELNAALNAADRFPASEPLKSLIHFIVARQK